MQSLIATTTC